MGPLPLAHESPIANALYELEEEHDAAVQLQRQAGASMATKAAEQP